MAEWIESYRGVVSAWECDIVEHFTIAYYFEKFADASRNFIELIDEGETLSACAGTAPSRFVATFENELRAGAAFHMTSAVTGIDKDQLHIGHQLVDSAKGKTVTWLAESLPLPRGLSAEARHRLETRAVPWPGPAVPAPSPLPASKGDRTARDRVKPWELDERGCLSLADHVHRFSGAGMHFLTSIGMTADYMHGNRRGISTFLLDVALISRAHVGERIDVHTAVAHLGNTSMRYVHRMTGADGRDVGSMVQGGVQLDLDARRPTPFPADIRSRIQAALG